MVFYFDSKIFIFIKINLWKINSVMGNSQNTHKNSQLYNDPAYMDDEKNLKKNLEPEIKKNNFSRKSIKKEPVIKRSNYQKNINYEIISTWNFIEDSEYNLHLLKVFFF